MEKPQVPLKCRLHLLSCWKAKLKTSKCNLSPLICSNHLLPPPSNQIWGTCKRPSQPTPISMKAPKATTFFTTPRAWFLKEVVVTHTQHPKETRHSSSSQNQYESTSLGTWSAYPCWCYGCSCCRPSYQEVACWVSIAQPGLKKPNQTSSRMCVYHLHILQNSRNLLRKCFTSYRCKPSFFHLTREIPLALMSGEVVLAPLKQRLRAPDMKSDCLLTFQCQLLVFLGNGTHLVLGSMWLLHMAFNTST